MASLNSVVLIGNLTADPELSYAQSGTAQCKFTLALNHYYKDKDGNRQEVATFVPIKVYGPQAENCDKYLKKGRCTAVEGRLSIRPYEKDGQKLKWTEVVANGVQFLGGGQDAGAADDEATPF